MIIFIICSFFLPICVCAQIADQRPLRLLVVCVPITLYKGQAAFLLLPLLKHENLVSVVFPQPC